MQAARQFITGADGRSSTTTTSPSSPPPSILTNCTLTYFPLPGRGEAIRLALTISDIPFVDHRVPFRSWPATKPTTPWGTLPILQLSDGTRLAQARSVLRFVGRETALYPAGDILRAQRVDELMDALEDFSAAVGGVEGGMEKGEMEAARAKAVEEGGAVYKILGRIDGFIGEHGVGGCAVGDSMTIADLLTFTYMGRLAGGVYFGVPPTVCDPFGNIQGVRKMVGRDARVMRWYDGRVGMSPAEKVLATCRDL